MLPRLPRLKQEEEMQADIMTLIQRHPFVLVRYPVSPGADQRQ